MTDNRDMIEQENARRHGIDVVPPTNVASPHNVAPADVDGIEMWWRPTWSETFATLGWRWLWFTPAVAIGIGAVLIPLRPTYSQVYFAFWKLIVMAIALPTGMFVRAAKTIVQRRTDPFCIHCGYSLIGATEGTRCPECGRIINLAVIEEYRRDPDWFIKRWRTRHEIPTRDAPFIAGKNRKASQDGT